MPDPVNPYAAPQSAVQDIHVTPSSVGFELASRGSRLGASMLDGLIMMTLFGGASLLTPWNLFEVEDTTALVALGGMGVGLWLMVNGYFLVTRGQTVGKMALKIRVLRPDGSPASAGRLIGLRYLLPGVINLIPFIGSIFSLVNPLFIFRDSRRCLHDEMADTIVVKA